MISIDNTRKPFMRKKAGFRRNGVKDYRSRRRASISRAPAAATPARTSGSPPCSSTWPASRGPASRHRRPRSSAARWSTSRALRPGLCGRDEEAGEGRLQRRDHQRLQPAAGGHVPRFRAVTGWPGAAVQHDLRAVLEGPRPRGAGRRAARARRATQPGARESPRGAASRGEEEGRRGEEKGRTRRRPTGGRRVG